MSLFYTYLISIFVCVGIPLIFTYITNAVNKRRRENIKLRLNELEKKVHEYERQTKATDSND